MVIMEGKQNGGVIVTSQSLFQNFPTLETDRLILRKLTKEDATDIFQYASDDEVARYVTWDSHKTVEDTYQFLQFAFDRYEAGQVAPWGIVYKADGKMIGTIDFLYWDQVHRRSEIGYVLAKPYWGQGIMTEAASKLLDFGFHKMELQRIEARCFVENIGSERVMQKIGMTYEGTLRKLMFIKGSFRNLKIYSILREEYFKNKE